MDNMVKMNIPENNVIKKEFTEGVPGHITDARYFYFDTESGSEPPPLSILCGGHETCAKDFELNRKNFPFHTIKFTLAGKGVFVCHDKTHLLHYGTLTGFGPKTPHYYKTDADDPLEHVFIIFRGTEANELLKKSALRSNHFILASNPDFTASVMKQILKAGFEKPPYAQEIACSYLRALLLEQTDAAVTANLNSPSLENFLRCKHHLDHHFETIRSSCQLAEECCLDIRYIARLFKRYKQIRPHEYLMHLKMNKAANLLLTTNLSVKQIAKMTGIEDPYYFSRKFKQKFNIAPIDYRRSFY